MDTTTGRGADDRTPDPFRGVIRRTRIGMAIEAALRAFWPLAAFGAVLWAALAFGLGALLARMELRLALAVSAGVATFLLVRGIRRFRLPSRAAAEARLDATLPGRPFESLGDRHALGAGDPASRAVWALHRTRMARIAADARMVPPDLRLARDDPWAFRLAALVALIAAAIFAREPAGDALATAFAPREAPLVATGPSFEGWAEPPAYTGRPTLYLPEVSGGTPLSLPQGTRITLRVYGQAAGFGLVESVSGDGAGALTGTLTEAAPGIAAAEFGLDRSGRVELSRDGEPLAAWSITAEPDAAPAIELAAPLTATAAGAASLAFTASDDHGVTGARAEITLDLDRVDRRYGLATEPEPRAAIIVDLPLPLARTAREVAETLVEDFSGHPWVGLPVTVRLTAEDAAGQTGRFETDEAALPGRRFYDPLAAALVEQRRDLLWSPDNARRVVQVLRAVSWRPEGAFDGARAYLITRTATRRLAEAVAADTVDAVRDEVAEALWQAALLLEEGSLGDAAERLARAQERLREALRDDAGDEEIARLMEELREATRDYMEQLAREAIERGESQRAEIPPDAQTMTQDQIQQLMDRIQELSEQGRNAEAEALLEMLQQMLENMQMMMAEGGGGQGQSGQGNEAMQGLADTLREQQGLADESFQQLQREFGRGMDGFGQGTSPQPGEPGGGEGLAERQEALRGLLEDLQRNLPGQAGEATREALREAERRMGEARDGLEEGDTAGALDRQAEAIDSLREGMRALGEEMRQAQSGEGEEGAQGDAAQAQRDPLGRPLGSQGGIGSNDRVLQGLDATARARAILDEIRRRAGEMERPEAELDYLRRLLDRF